MPENFTQMREAYAASNHFEDQKLLAQALLNPTNAYLLSQLMDMYPTTAILSPEQFSEGISTLERRLLKFFLPSPSCGKSVPEYTLTIGADIAPSHDPKEEEIESSLDYLQVVNALI